MTWKIYHFCWVLLLTNTTSAGIVIAADILPFFINDIEYFISTTTTSPARSITSGCESLEHGSFEFVAKTNFEAAVMIVVINILFPWENVWLSSSLDVTNTERHWLHEMADPSLLQATQHVAGHCTYVNGTERRIMVHETDCTKEAHFICAWESPASLPEITQPIFSVESLGKFYTIPDETLKDLLLILKNVKVATSATSERATIAAKDQLNDIETKTDSNSGEVYVTHAYSSNQHVSAIPGRVVQAILTDDALTTQPGGLSTTHSNTDYRTSLTDSPTTHFDDSPATSPIGTSTTHSNTDYRTSLTDSPTTHFDDSPATSPIGTSTTHSNTDYRTSLTDSPTTHFDNTPTTEANTIVSQNQHPSSTQSFQSRSETKTDGPSDTPTSYTDPSAATTQDEASTLLSPHTRQTGTTSTPKVNERGATTKQSSASRTCPCSCLSARRLNEIKNMTSDVIEELTDTIKKNLTVDTSSLSSTIRTKTSAFDARPTSKLTGIMGVVFLVLIFGSIVILDLVQLLVYLLCSL